MFRRNRAFLLVVAAAALFAAADTANVNHNLGVIDSRQASDAIFLNAAAVQPIDPSQQRVLTNPRPTDRYSRALAKGEQIREGQVVESAAKATLERAKREAAAAVAGQPQPWLGGNATGSTAALPGVGLGGYALPAVGTFTSGFGVRWGVMHAGIDIANAIGTPEYAVAAGTVIDAGPASGFGLWVRIRHDDGTISVYGHMYDFFVSVGERVPAGMQIARMGTRGDSTGSHLHFEIIINGQHVDPQRWLALHGIRVG